MREDAGTFIMIGLLLAFLAGGALGDYMAKDSMRNEAVKRKAADWVPNEHGKPKFVWKN